MLKYTIVFLLLFLSVLGNPYDPNFPQNLNSRIKEWNEMAKTGELTVDDEGSYIDYDKNPQFAMMMGSPIKDAAYWESIYGPDDVPDFDKPPEIIGDSVYVDSIQSYDNYEPNFQKIKDAREFSKFDPIIEEGKGSAIPALQHARKRSSTDESRISEWKNPLLVENQNPGNFSPLQQEFEKMGNFNKNRRQIKRRKMVFNAAEENERVKRKNWRNGHDFEEEDEPQADEVSNFENFKNPYSIDFYPNHHENYFDIREGSDSSGNPIWTHDFRSTEASKNYLEKARSQHRVETMTRKMSEVSGKKENEFRELTKEMSVPIVEGNDRTSIIEKSEISGGKEISVDSDANLQRGTSRRFMNNVANKQHQMQVRNATTENFVSESKNTTKKEVANGQFSKQDFNQNSGTEAESEKSETGNWNFSKQNLNQNSGTEAESEIGNWNFPKQNLNQNSGTEAESEKSETGNWNFSKQNLNQKSETEVESEKSKIANWNFSKQNLNQNRGTEEKSEIADLKNEGKVNQKNIADEFEFQKGKSNANNSENLQENFEKDEELEVGENLPIVQKVKKHVDDSDKDCKCVPPTLEKISSIVSDETVPENPENSVEGSDTNVDEALEEDAQDSSDAPEQVTDSVGNPDPTDAPEPTATVTTSLNVPEVPEEPLERKLAYQAPVGKFVYGRVPLTNHKLQIPGKGWMRVKNFHVPLPDTPKSVDLNPGNSLDPNNMEISNNPANPMEHVSRMDPVPASATNAAPPGSADPTSARIHPPGPLPAQLTYEIPNELLNLAVNKAVNHINRIIEDARDECDTIGRPAINNKIISTAVEDAKGVIDEVAREIAQAKQLKMFKDLVYSQNIRGENAKQLKSLQVAPQKIGNSRNPDGVYWNRCVHCGSVFLANHDTRCPYHRQSLAKRYVTPAATNFNGKIIHHFDDLDTDIAGKENFNKRYVNWDCNCSGKDLRCPQCEYSGDNLTDIFEPPPVIFDIIETNLNDGRNYANDMHSRAKSLASGGLHPKPHTASMLHFLNNKATDSVVKINQQSEKILFGLKFLRHRLHQRQVYPNSIEGKLKEFLFRYKITPNSFVEFLKHHGFHVQDHATCTARRKRCRSASRYRNYDGSCNNCFNPTWGQSNTAFTRLLPPRYADGIHAIPRSGTGRELPNPRALSVTLFPRRNVRDRQLTLSIVQWGQMLAHDFARQFADQTVEGGIECCTTDGGAALPKYLQHHSCLPVEIPKTDNFYSRHGLRCMNFVRSMTATRQDCSFGPADQLNGATSYLDLSQMYGSDKKDCDKLRLFIGGRLKVDVRQNRHMMPNAVNKSLYCDVSSPSDFCYQSGDVRVNQNPQLVVLQTLLVREHNRLANDLSILNPHWNDERIFQESRRILIAEYQHITYHEWLPLVIGRKHSEKYGLLYNGFAPGDDYDGKMNPGTITAFTSGVFRYFHSMVEGNIVLHSSNYSSRSFNLSDHYFKPGIIEKDDNFDNLLRGLAMQPMQRPDPFFHKEVTEYLFRSKNEYGMDLVTIDIQRGRDHGLPGYNAFRRICRLEAAKDFSDLRKEIPWENVIKLQSTYEDVDDIDLLVGAALETPAADGGILGPTSQCLVTEQFYRSRVGDKYFYDHANFPHSFTPEQYHEIKKATLSRLFCDMGDAVFTVQFNAFKSISSKNPLIKCANLPKINLSPWREIGQENEKTNS